MSPLFIGEGKLMTFADILRMTAATAGYVVMTGLLWRFLWTDKAQTNTKKILIGLIYGACSVAANHFGIHVGDLLILNVRDIGPLAAGLFFSPVSGIIAGTIGGVERFLAGELWGIGTFTEIACGMSTFLAGILSAVLKEMIYHDRRPPVTQAFFLGAVTEVFHMYAILFTNRSALNMAYFVVQMASVPMIIFTAAGLVLCSITVMKIAGDKMDPGLSKDAEKIPITVLFQRSLMVVTVVLFAFNFIVSYNLQTRLVNESAENELNAVAFEKKAFYDETNDLKELTKTFLNTGDYSTMFCIMDAETGAVVYYYNDMPREDSFSPEDMEKLLSIQDKTPVKLTLAEFPEMPVLVKVTTLSSGKLLVLFREMQKIYSVRDSQIYESTLSDILLFTVLYILVAMLVDRLVVKNLHRVNASLRRITGGDLNETVWVHSSAEFTELSDDINKTVAALRGYIDAAEKHIQDELKLAATIQDSALPKNFRLPSNKIELFALMTPAKTVGGDFYDFFYVSKDQLCLVIADVSGKGVPASLFMMRAKTAIKYYSRSGLGLAEILQKVNHTLCEGNDADMFVTVWVGILNLTTGQMLCSNAGHEYPLLMRAGGDYEVLRDKHSLALAIMKGIPLKEYEIQLNPGDRLFVYTDGVPEAINEKEEAYGLDRLAGRLNRLKNVSQEWALEDVLQDIRNFAGKAEQFDDITMLGLTYR